MGHVKRISRQRNRARIAKLTFERLEVRCLLASRTWDGGDTSDAWEKPKNWSDDTVPGPGDLALFAQSATPVLLADVKFVDDSDPNNVVVLPGVERVQLSTDEITPRNVVIDLRDKQLWPNDDISVYQEHTGTGASPTVLTLTTTTGPAFVTPSNVKISNSIKGHKDNLSKLEVKGNVLLDVSSSIDVGGRSDAELLIENAFVRADKVDISGSVATSPKSTVTVTGSTAVLAADSTILVGDSNASGTVKNTLHVDNGATAGGAAVLIRIGNISPGTLTVENGKWGHCACIQCLTKGGKLLRQFVGNRRK